MNQQRFPTFRRIARWCVRVAPRVGFGLLVLFVLAAIPWTYFNIKWGRELEAKLAELKAQGMPLTMAEAAPKDVPDDQNAAVLYQKVFGEFSSPGLMPERWHIGGMTDEEYRVVEDYVTATDTAVKVQAREILNRPAVQRDLATIRQASQRPYSVFPINWEDGVGALFPHLSCFRHAVQVLAAQAQVCAEAGRLDEALDWCEVALRMSEHAASEPTLIGQLVGYAMQAITFDALLRIVDSAPVSGKIGKPLGNHLGKIDLYDTFTTAMKTESTFGRWYFDLLKKEGPGAVIQLVDGHHDFPEELGFWIYGSRLGRPVQRLDELTYLAYMGRQVELTKLPYREAGPKIKALRQEMTTMPFYLVVTRLLTAVFSKATQRRDWAVANIGLCRVVLALKAYKYKHGAYPQSLRQLQETLHWELPEDPFSGTDFIYQRHGEGFMLYSIGQDLDDDGGIPPEEPRSWGEGDIVWECSG